MSEKKTSHVFTHYGCLKKSKQSTPPSFLFTQTNFRKTLDAIHTKSTPRMLLRLHKRAYAVEAHPEAVWSTPEEILKRGLTNSLIHLAEPFSDYMRVQIDVLFSTTSFSIPTHSLKPLKQCNTLDILLPRLRITFVYSVVIVQGIGNGEIIDSDAHFEDLLQRLVDLRTDLRTALLMALHPRLGAQSMLGGIGEDLMRGLI